MPTLVITHWPTSQPSSTTGTSATSSAGRRRRMILNNTLLLITGIWCKGGSNNHRWIPTHARRRWETIVVGERLFLEDFVHGRGHFGGLNHVATVFLFSAIRSK